MLRLRLELMPNSNGLVWSDVRTGNNRIEATVKPKSSFDNNAGFRDELLLLKLIYGSTSDAFKALLEELGCSSTLRRLRRRYSRGMRVEHPRFLNFAIS